ncbi:hypothetical protein M153_7160004102 [Pseudoloma neurophilia]|uniref:Uncharacterized protein n=1 Tax=Pseudoloma neurophilia TaxID=146866 RepID=A0A0R0LW97_9MICR|nr:hypothetical protein M153_7160004102 [Pseudoloma neurophilia]
MNLKSNINRCGNRLSWLPAFVFIINKVFSDTPQERERKKRIRERSNKISKIQQ